MQTYVLLTLDNNSEASQVAFPQNPTPWYGQFRIPDMTLIMFVYLKYKSGQELFTAIKQVMPSVQSKQDQHRSECSYKSTLISV